MNRDEVVTNIGKYATVNRAGDSGFDPVLRSLTQRGDAVKIVRLTKSGMAEIELSATPFKTTLVRPSNLDLI